MTELLYGKNNLQITSILTIISGSVNDSTADYIVSHFKKIVELIKHEDINIKRESLSVILSLLKYSPILLRDLIIENKILDILYELIKKNNSYITSVQIGPVQNISFFSLFPFFQLFFFNFMSLRGRLWNTNSKNYIYNIKDIN